MDDGSWSAFLTGFAGVVGKLARVLSRPASQPAPARRSEVLHYPTVSLWLVMFEELGAGIYQRETPVTQPNWMSWNSIEVN